MGDISKRNGSEIWLGFIIIRRMVHGLFHHLNFNNKVNVIFITLSNSNHTYLINYFVLKLEFNEYKLINRQINEVFYFYLSLKFVMDKIFLIKRTKYLSFIEESSHT